MQYRVIWEIDIFAETPEEAARKALAIHRNPESIATCFEVFDEDGEKTSVDLLELDEVEEINPHGMPED